MSQGDSILALDQGTTSTRAIIFDRQGQPVAMAQESLAQIYPRPAWVEHDPEAIWQAALRVMKSVFEKVPPYSIAALGITNQRETSVLWERQTGRAVGNAIVWQDRRTADLCEQLKAEGLGPMITETTGLLIDPYFSATKIAWALEADRDLGARAKAGEICFGTIDSWLIFKLTGGRNHVTDATNASRTMLYDIRNGAWDETLLERFSIPAIMLPEVRNCQDDYGEVSADYFGVSIPIRGVAGDQQAAAYGQACFAPGAIKATFGTGCFMLVHSGAKKIASSHRMLTTIASEISGTRSYALEGSIFMAGATLQWLRDNLSLFQDVRESEALARAADEDSGVYLVPSFQGLGAPHWDAGARGALLGLSRASSKPEIVRAGLESVAFQTRDLFEAICCDMADARIPAPKCLRVDGGMTANQWLMQFLSDMLDLPVEVAEIAETTALGAAFHAGLAVGFFASEDALKALWRRARLYQPGMGAREREGRYRGWQQAVKRVRSEQGGDLDISKTLRDARGPAEHDHQEKS